MSLTLYVQRPDGTSEPLGTLESFDTPPAFHLPFTDLPLAAAIGQGHYTWSVRGRLPLKALGMRPLRSRKRRIAKKWWKRLWAALRIRDRVEQVHSHIPYILRPETCTACATAFAPSARATARH